MSDHLLWWENDRNPSITDTITINGVAVDLSAAAAQFKMRALGAATLKVNQPVTFKDATGLWRYDWGATDLDTADEYLCWVEVTVGGKVQTVSEAIVEVRAHDAGSPAVYVELEQLKSTAEMTGFTFADQDGLAALAAASRAVDEATGRRFYLDADATQVRYYTANGHRRLLIDDLVTLTTLKVDRFGDGVYEETWTNGTDFILEPANAAADARPYESILIRYYRRGLYWPCNVEKGVEVTGKFGWLTAPPEIKVATTMIAARLMKRMREAPFGVVSLGQDGAAVRIAKTDPDVCQLLDPFDRRAPFL